MFDRSKDASPFAGPAWDGLEAGLLRAFTDLGPVDASVMPLGAIQARARRKLGSLTRRLTTYDLLQRVDLWILNRVFGKSGLQIASDMQEAGAVEPDRDPIDRVRKHLREMHRRTREDEPVLIERHGKGGLMYEATVGVQKFKVEEKE